MSGSLPIAASNRGPEIFTSGAGQTAFAGNYPLLDKNDVEVLVSTDGGLNWTLKALDSHYTIAGTVPLSSFTITFLSGLNSGDKVLHYGKAAIKNTTDFSPANTLKKAGLNAKLDQLTVYLQERFRDFSTRTKRVRIGETLNEIPSAAARALRLPKYDAGGQEVAGPLAADIEAGVPEAQAQADIAGTHAARAAGLAGLAQNLVKKIKTVSDLLASAPQQVNAAYAATLSAMQRARSAAAEAASVPARVAGFAAMAQNAMRRALAAASQASAAVGQITGYAAAALSAMRRARASADTSQAAQMQASAGAAASQSFARRSQRSATASATSAASATDDQIALKSQFFG